MYGADSLPTIFVFNRESVISPPRIPRILAGSIITVHLCLLAPVPAGTAVAAVDESEMAAFLAAQPRWSYSADVETIFGYKDNLLLSAHGEERSTFARGGVEALLLLIPRRNTDFSLFAQADGTRFFSGKTVNQESEAWVQSEIGYRITESFKVSLPVTGYHYDQVFDVSDTEAARLVAHLKVAGGMVGPTVRWAFHPSWWIEAQAVGERKRYDDGTNDSRVGEGSVRLGWRVNGNVGLRFEGRQRWRDFDERVRYTSAGRPLSDTVLKIAEEEAEVRADVDWGRKRRWKTSTRFGGLRYRDNGSGYFAYDQSRIGHEVTWKHSHWFLRLEASAERLEFQVQTVGIGIDPPPRIKDEFAAKFHLERKIAEHWTVFGGYRWERSRSNEAIASYILNEGLLGARWSWEK